MESVSSRIWTRIAVFISYGDNDYTTGTSLYTYLILPYFVLYSFWTSLVHSLIMRLAILSLSPHNLLSQFCCGQSISAFIWLFLMIIFCVPIKKSFSLVRFSFLTHVFSCAILTVCRLKYPYRSFCSNFCFYFFLWFSAPFLCSYWFFSVLKLVFRCSYSCNPRVFVLFLNVGESASSFPWHI